MNNKRLTQPAPLLRLVPWMVVGILLADALPMAINAWPLAAMLMLTAMSGRWPLIQSVGLGFCVMLLGMVLTSHRRQQTMWTSPDRVASYEAIVVSEPAERPKTMAVDLLLPDKDRRVKAYIYKEVGSQSLLPGDAIVIRTRIEPADSLSLGTFDYGRYLHVQGFAGRCFVRSGDWQRTEGVWNKLPHLERLRIHALRWRHKLIVRYHSLASGNADAYGVLTAMTLGDKRALSQEMRDTYSQAGASHVLALSGLHMGILYALLSLFILPARRKTMAQLTMVLLFWTFALLTGLSMSVVRSALMLSVATVFSMRNGSRAPLNVLALAALTILIVNAYALFDVGFQLSFLSVLSILLIMPLLEHFWPEGFLLRHRMIKVVWSLLAVGLAAQIGVAPLIAYYFGRLPVYFLLTNIVVIPMAYLVLWLAMAFLLMPVSLLGQTLLRVTNWMNAILSAISQWPGASIDGLHPSVLQTTMAYVAIAALYLAALRWRGLKVKI